MGLKRWSTAAALLQVAAVVLAHGHDGDKKMDMDMASPDTSSSADTLNPEQLPSYAGLDQHRGAIMLHIVFMVLAWFFTLPIGM